MHIRPTASAAFSSTLEPLAKMLVHTQQRVKSQNSETGEGKLGTCKSNSCRICIRVTWDAGQKGWFWGFDAKFPQGHDKS